WRHPAAGLYHLCLCRAEHWPAPTHAGGVCGRLWQGDSGREVGELSVAPGAELPPQGAGPMAGRSPAIPERRSISTIFAEVGGILLDLQLKAAAAGDGELAAGGKSLPLLAVGQLHGQLAADHVHDLQLVGAELIFARCHDAHSGAAFGLAE